MFSIVARQCHKLAKVITPAAAQSKSWLDRAPRHILVSRYHETSVMSLSAAKSRLLNAMKGESNSSQAKNKKKNKNAPQETKRRKTSCGSGFSIAAYATCNEMNLENLKIALIKQDLYIPTELSDEFSDVIHVTAKYPIGDESREIFFFREGSVVFWNMNEFERINVLKFLKAFEEESYKNEEIFREVEYMTYSYDEQRSAPSLSNGWVKLNPSSDSKLVEKYSFSNALVLSVKLGIWESILEDIAEEIGRVTEALKRGDKLMLSRAEVLKKTGELYSLRHEINLNSDLLDTPDFYWDREGLERIYQTTCDYLSISRRTQVMNEKLGQCCELLDLISNHLNDRHHTRMELMIIALIAIEVGFEILHVLERYGTSPIL